MVCINCYTQAMNMSLARKKMSRFCSTGGSLSVTKKKQFGHACKVKHQKN